MKMATLLIQKRFRDCMQMRKERQNFLDSKAAAVDLQSWWRMMKQQKLYKEEVSKVVTCEEGEADILGQEECSAEAAELDQNDKTKVGVSRRGEKGGQVPGSYQAGAAEAEVPQDESSSN